MAETLHNSSANPTFVPTRYTMALLGCMALAIVNVLKTNQFSAKVLYHDGWQELSSWLYTFPVYLAILLPTGILAERLSAKWMIFGLMLVNVGGAFAQEFSRIYDKFIAVGVPAVIVSGLTNGAIYPTMSVMLAKWSPPRERSFLLSLVYAGAPLGLCIAILLRETVSNVLRSAMIFLCLLWFVAWGTLIETSPDRQMRGISTYEKNYISESLGVYGRVVENSKKSFPFHKVITSKPLISLILADSCVCLVYATLMSIQVYLPGSLPYFHLSWLNQFLSSMFTVLFGALMTAVLMKNFITITNCRKIATFVSLFGPLACLIFSAYAKNSNILFALNSGGIVLSTARLSGTVTNVIDIAANFSGTLVATLMIFECIAVSSMSYIVYFNFGSDFHNGDSTTVWIFTAVMVVLSVLTMGFYYFCGTAEEQSWNRKDSIGSVYNADAILLADSVKCEMNEALNL